VDDLEAAEKLPTGHPGYSGEDRGDYPDSLARSALLAGHFDLDWNASRSLAA